MVLAPGPREFICSARSCRSPAQWLIEWSNPEIHYGRTKKWLACDDHLEELRGYFEYRSFPHEVSVFEGPADGSEAKTEINPVSPSES